MPNGLTDFFWCNKQALDGALRACPAGSIVATGTRSTEPEWSPLTAKALSRMLRAQTGAFLTVNKEDSAEYLRGYAWYYTIRGDPPAEVIVRQGSRLFRTIERVHQGQLFIFPKDEFLQILDRLRADSVVADEVIRARLESFDINADLLAGMLRADARESIGVMVMDDASYVLRLNPGPRFVAIHARSALFPAVHRLQKSGRTGPE